MQRKGFRPSSKYAFAFASHRLLTFKSIHTLQRATLLRSQGFTPDNNQELANLLRFISTLQSQQAQQNGILYPSSTLHYVVLLTRS